jgi:hypothetical protein
VVVLLALCVGASSQVQIGIEGRWEGTLTQDSTKLRLVLDVTRASDGLLIGMIANLDHGVRLLIDRIEESGDRVRLAVNAIGGSYDGVLSSDGARLTGNWTQGTAAPLEFRRSATGPEPPRAETRRADSADAFGMPVEMKVPVPPTPFQGDGRTHLAYELHITNFADSELLIRRLEILVGDTALASFEGTQLISMLQRPGAPTIIDKRSVGAGQRAIAYIWISAGPNTRMPASLRHRITGRTESVVGGVAQMSSAPPVVLGPPVRGSNWVAVNGPENSSGHRRALLPFGGNTAIGQRFAIDWLQSGPDGSFVGNPKDNTSYRAYGQELLAVGDGVVVSVRDGIADNVPGPGSRAVPIGPETIAGNFIVIDLGSGRFAFYGHVQPGSLRVKAGDKVRRGQVLGVIGNSGNSDEPHLHFHVADSPDPFSSEGLPYVIDSFETLTPPTVWQRRNNELPLQGAIVRFPER